MAKKVRPRDLLMTPWLPRGGLALLYGPSGVGKTHLTLGISVAVATAGSFLVWNAPRRRPVTIFDGEMDDALLQQWLRETKEQAGVRRLPKHMRLITSAQVPGSRLPDLSDPEAQRDFYHPLCEGSSLVIFDNLDSLAGTKGDRWGNSLQTFVLQLRQEGCAVILADHSNKAGSNRGSSRKYTNLDAVIKLTRPEDYSATEGARFTVSFEKNRGFFGPDAESFEAALINNDWQCSKPNPVQARVKNVLDALATGPMTTKEIHNHLGNNCRAAELRSILNSLEMEGIVLSFKETHKAGRPATVWVRPVMN